MVRKTALKHWDRKCAAAACAAEGLPLDDARDTVLDAYDAFSPKMAGIAKRFFDERWIDAPVRPGKQPGAFAHPTGALRASLCAVELPGQAARRDDLAHELGPWRASGFGWPEWRADGADAADPLAETASVFGEMLTFRALLLNTTNAAQRVPCSPPRSRTC